MKTPTQEEVEAAFEFFNPERGFPLNADKFHRNLATLRAALEAKAHSKADCLRVAAEWLDGFEADCARMGLFKFRVLRALRTEADIRDSQKTY